MEQTFNSIGLEINKVVFDESTQCTLWGKVFVENGYYYADIQVSLAHLYQMITHNPVAGKMLQCAIGQELLGKEAQYPLVLDIIAYFGHALLLNADRLVINKIKTRYRNADGKVHYALRVMNVLKLNKLTIIQNIRTIARLTTIPQNRVIHDEPQLEVAYRMYSQYKSIDMTDYFAKTQSGLQHPSIFTLAHFGATGS